MPADDEPIEGSRYGAREANAGDARGLGRLFEAAHSTCYCRYWHFEGDKNDWLDRSANHEGESRGELEAALTSASPEASGIVATSGVSEIVGWLKLSPVAAVMKAFTQRYYRALPCFGGDRDGVYLIGCVLVHPAHRFRGVARRLITEALSVARLRGARSVEALPRRTTEPVTGEELWMGPLSVYRSLGFVEVHRTELTDLPDPYPVLRLEIPRSDG